jgi:SOS-response transcriptional repressor LexA
LGLPISFEKAIEQGAGRVAMANLARRDVSTRVVDALYPVLSEAMGRRLPTTQPLLTVLRASEVASYQAVKKHVYEGPALSVFTRAAMDSGDEVRVARLLDKAEDVLGWAYNHARVGYAIDYEWEGRPAKYIPDFVARAKLGAVEHHVLIEVKGRFDDRDKAKARRGLEYARLLTAADGRPWHYVFLLENPPRKDISWWEVQSVTRLADLLRRHELLPLFPIKGASAQTIELALVPQAPETDRYVRALPVFDLVAAAGDFGNSQAPEPLGWLPLSIELPLDRQCFVAKMQGDSMETPDGGVPNGAWVMFRRYGTNVPSVGALDGRRLLLELRDATDPENGGRYTVKRLRITAVDGEGAVQAVELRPDNPARSPIAVGVDDGALRVVAELVRVLG